MQPPAMELTAATADDFGINATAFSGTLFINPNGMPVFYQPSGTEEYIEVKSAPLPVIEEGEAATFKLELAQYTAYYLDPAAPQGLWCIPLPNEDGTVSMLISGSIVRAIIDFGETDLVDYLKAYIKPRPSVYAGYIPDGTRRYYPGDDFLVTLEDSTTHPCATLIGKSWVNETFTEKEFSDRLNEYPSYWGTEAAMYDLLTRLHREEVIGSVDLLPHFSAYVDGDGFQIGASQAKGYVNFFDYNKMPFTTPCETPADLIKSIFSGIARCAKTMPSSTIADREAIALALKADYSKHYHRLISALVQSYFFTPGVWGLDEDGNIPEGWDWKRKPAV